MRERARPCRIPVVHAPDPKPKRKNPVIDFVENMTAEEHATFEYLAERDREDVANAVADDDALPSEAPTDAK